MTFEYDLHGHKSDYGHEGKKRYACGPMYGPFMKKFMTGFGGSFSFRNHQYTTPEGDYVRTAHATVEFDDESNTYNIVMELPGVSKDNIDIKATEDSLKVVATRKSIREPEKEMKYNRRFDFKRNIVTESITAKFNEGLLNLILPVKEKPSSSVDIS
ncbi:MAG: Hsp20/alpha crystallin family protein [Candidatus Hodarchaeales archaeon]|jgi:HSP20 family protein